jgi:hypothetical protein
MKQQSFGRRMPQSVFSRTTRPPLIRAESHLECRAQAKRLELGASAAKTQPLKDELLEWKRVRRHNYRLPWRQISLMASASFGIGYFVLPESVNQTVQWLLLALAILSFVSSFSRRPTQSD